MSSFRVPCFFNHVDHQFLLLHHLQNSTLMSHLTWNVSQLDHLRIGNNNSCAKGDWYFPDSKMRLPFFSLDREAKTKRIYVIHETSVQLRPWGVIYPIITSTTVYQIYSLTVILLILWIFLEMVNFTMVRVWLRPRAGPETIVNVWLLTLDKLSCEIMLVYFWVHLNARTNCVIVHKI